MLDDLLMVGEQEAGGVILKITPIDLYMICRDISSDLSNMYGQSHHLVLNAQPGTDYTIEADERYITRILLNLVSNAFKYSDEGTTITLELVAYDDAVQLIVSDEGIGIPSEDISALFDIYKRAGNVGGVRGKGIGLAVVKQGVDIHDGTIEVQSVEDKGTTFTITMPRAHVTSEETGSSPVIVH